HQPFTKMAYKAHRHLLNYCGHDTDQDDIDRAIGHTTAYNRVIGNSYTASVYLGLAALLDRSEDLTGRPLAFLSYGSGSVAEFFAGTVVAGYRERLRTDANRRAIERRTEVDHARYRDLHEWRFPADGGEHATPEQTTGPFRLAGISGHQRIYQAR
ncbi:hydroxymethylglutaryl-CoA synthase, partial [Streptomyces galbus]